jgi:hypothetical protein
VHEFRVEYKEAAKVDKPTIARKLGTQLVAGRYAMPRHGERSLTPLFAALLACCRSLPVTQWRGLSPPGRFLTKTVAIDEEGTSIWQDVGDKIAQKRASKNLGEREMIRKRGPSLEETELNASPSKLRSTTTVGAGRIESYPILDIDAPAEKRSSVIVGTTTLQECNTVSQT